jgi:hypothetical protein
MWKIFRLALAGILAFIHYFYMIKDEYFNGVWDRGPFMVIMNTDFWWVGGLYFFSFLTMYYIILTTDNSDFGWKSISFYTIGHIIMTLIAISICRSSEVNNIIENGMVGIVLSFLSMLLLRGISVGSLLDGGANHVKNVLHKSNDKRAKQALEDLAKSSPEGAKAVANAIAIQNTIEKAGRGAQQDMDDIRKKYNLKH